MKSDISPEFQVDTDYLFLCLLKEPTPVTSPRIVDTVEDYLKKQDWTKVFGS